MRKILALAACLLSLYAPCSLFADNVKIGNFPIDGVTQFGSFVLDDGHSYKPRRSQVSRTKSWQLGDVIMVLKKKGTKTYILVNTRTGEIAKAKIVPVT